LAEARVRKEALRRNAAARLEIERQRRRSVRAAITFFERDRRFAGGLLAGGLAFRIFLWLLPLALVAATVLSALALAGLWRLPRPAEVPGRRLLPGSLLLGVGAEAIRLFVSLYLAAKLGRSAGLYGSLGLAVVFLTWLYLVGRLIVGAVNLNATLWEASRLGAASQPSDRA
jgi:uncharacterized BrkB/YihY/UPF0761 family membrane protein